MIIISMAALALFTKSWGIHRLIANAIRVKHRTKHHLLVVEEDCRWGCPIIRSACHTVVRLALLFHVLNIECEATRRSSCRAANYLIEALLGVTLSVAKHVLRQLVHWLLHINVEKHRDFAVNHVRVILLKIFLQAKHYRLIDAVKQVAFIGKNHDHVIVRVWSLLDLIDPTSYILYVLLVRQVTHD